ncbi:MAG: hypothetical protein NTY47_07840 [Candidatus Omnitrophica bacterium]|nr:hypothetical protein [Candidatus Omnitrophota bacterium]
MKNKKIRIAVIVIASFFILSIAKDAIVKSVVTAVASNVAGTRVTAQGLSMGVFTGNVRISGLKVYNPQGFPDGALLDMPLIKVNCRLPALLKNKIDVSLVDIKLKQLIVVKNKEGKLNIDSLKVSQKEGSQPGKKQEAMGFHIDLFNLEIGRVVNKDLSVGAKPVIEAYELNFKRSYRNINSPQQLVALVLVGSLEQTAIKGAKIYGVAALAGVAILPVGIVSMFAGKDYASANFNNGFDRVFSAAKEAGNELGSITSSDKAAGVIKLQVNGAEAEIKISKASRTTVTVLARKYLFPKPEIAAGILYVLSEKVK